MRGRTPAAGRSALKRNTSLGFEVAKENRRLDSYYRREKERQDKLDRDMRANYGIDLKDEDDL